MTFENTTTNYCFNKAFDMKDFKEKIIVSEKTSAILLQN